MQDENGMGKKIENGLKKVKQLVEAFGRRITEKTVQAAKKVTNNLQQRKEQKKEEDKIKPKGPTVS